MTLGDDGLVVSSIELAVGGSRRDHRDPDQGGQGERNESGGTHVVSVRLNRDIRSGLW